MHGDMFGNGSTCSFLLDIQVHFLRIFCEWAESSFPKPQVFVDLDLGRPSEATILFGSAGGSPQVLRFWTALGELPKNHDWGYQGILHPYRLTRFAQTHAHTHTLFTIHRIQTFECTDLDTFFQSIDPLFLRIHPDGNILRAGRLFLFLAACISFLVDFIYVFTTLWCLIIPFHSTSC